MVLQLGSIYAQSQQRYPPNPHPDSGQSWPLGGVQGIQTATETDRALGATLAREQAMSERES